MTEFTTASGEVLIDEDIEALADEAERGYDLDKATKVTADAVPRHEGDLAARSSARRPRPRQGPARPCSEEHRSVSEIAVPPLRECLDRAA